MAEGQMGQQRVLVLVLRAQVPARAADTAADTASAVPVADTDTVAVVGTEAGGRALHIQLLELALAPGLPPVQRESVLALVLVLVQVWARVQAQTLLQELLLALELEL